MTCIAVETRAPVPTRGTPGGAPGRPGLCSPSMLTEEDLGGISSWADGLMTCLHWTLYWQKSHLP